MYLKCVLVLFLFSCNKEEMNLINFMFSGGILEPADPISFQIIDQDKYLAYGFLHYVGSDIYRISKNGTSHTTGKSIAKVKFNPSTEVVTLIEDIITVGANQNLEEGNAGVIDGKIWVFPTITDDLGDYTDIGYQQSTDGLIGETYGSITSIVPDTTYERYSTYGKLIPGDAAGEYFKPWFEHLDGGSDPWRVNLYHTLNNGSTWTNINLYDALTPQLSETAFINLGAGKMLCLSRRNDSPYGLYQSVSSNSGVTWGSFTEANLTTDVVGGTAQSNADMCINYKGTIDVVYMVRGTGNIYLSKDNNPDAVFADETAWNTPEVIASPGGNGNPHGYPSIINIDDGKNGRQSRNNYLIVFTKDNALADTDFYYGFGSI